MSVRVPVPVDRPCGNCGKVFIPAVLTWPDPNRDLCEECADAFIQRMLSKADATEGRYDG